MFQKNDHRRSQIEALMTFLSKVAPGSALSFVEIEQGTGVRMNHQGKLLMRAAMSKLHLKYIKLPGFGVKLSSPETAVERVDQDRRGIRNAIERAADTTELMLEQHGERMSNADAAKLTVFKAQLGALGLSRTLTEGDQKRGKARLVGAGLVGAG